MGEIPQGRKPGFLARSSGMLAAMSRKRKSGRRRPAGTKIAGASTDRRPQRPKPQNAPEMTWQVGAGQAGQTLAALVRARLGVSWNQAKRHVATGKVFVDGAAATDIARRPAVGQRVEVRMSAPRPQSAGSRVRIVHEDAHVVVIDKPAGVASVPYEDRETGTAMDLLRAAWRRKYPDAKRVPLHVVHRIDKATSGLLMFAKSKRAEVGLGAQLRAHTLDREYLCAVHGRVTPGRIESRLLRDRGDGLRGSSKHGRDGKRAVTHVGVIEHVPATRLGNPPVTLCRVHLETGKTHQIRIHLAERGHPLIGERVYIRDFVNDERIVLSAPRLLLHAHTLGFEHPVTGAQVACQSPLPDDFVSALTRLGWAGTSPV